MIIYARESCFVFDAKQVLPRRNRKGEYWLRKWAVDQDYDDLEGPGFSQLMLLSSQKQARWNAAALNIPLKDGRKSAGL